MANKIDVIEVDGQTYEFVDQAARDATTTLSAKVTKLNESQTEALKSESQRAKEAEQALEDAKVSKETGKGLSTNDFTNEYKGMLDNPAAMTGATAMTDGNQGDVPAPQKGDQGKYLRGDGLWETPHDTTYERATQSADGLMSYSDKKKLDAMDQDSDDTVSCNTQFTGNQIIQTLGNGKTRTLTFNADGSISDVIAKQGMDTIRLRTVFNDDGSITRTRG